ncbi:MFS general substrate transporter [Trichoderma reesei RUT C-30]|uniref:MFS general substrate transporter n=1 Tax=Hypocrea jecorina (strain ATCC 56765 / BCRC 32924 / NRRL 11460 / Rut C-30) TaxID=1344414 RepID=A0A024SM24_HYPJR|nr:MFS general substrate transporter [Trichoderma reesei RUT C-30]
MTDSSMSAFGRLANSHISYSRFILDQPLITPAVLSQKYEGLGTSSSPYLVTWIEHDPRNAREWSQGRKMITTAVMAILTLAAAFVSSTFSGCRIEIISELHTNNEVFSLGIALYVLGFALGPLLWAPLGELYGRQIIFFVTYGAFTAFNAGSAAAQNISSLVILRFFAGAFASSALTNPGGVITDMYDPTHRGLAMALFAAGPFMGPVLGPIVGGFLGETHGWRWVSGLTAIFSGTLWITNALLVPETHAPYILRTRARKMCKMTGHIYRSKVDADKSDKTTWGELKLSLTRPWALLFFEPIVLLLSIYMSIIYGTLYMFFAAIPIVFQGTRGWSEGKGGLAFLGILVGVDLAVLSSILYQRRYKRMVQRNKDCGGTGSLPPEARLPMSMVGAISLPIGLSWFAWTNYPNVHWMVSIAAGVPFGLGMVLVFTSVSAYLVDTYSVMAASALAANVVMRSTCAAVFPLFTEQMYKALGIHWASTIPAILTLICAPLPFFFYNWGSRIRARCKYSAAAQEFQRTLDEK